MKNKIKVLPEHIYNHIAAGEVILRPASIVKELIENSLDADSESIIILLLEGGKNLIQVIDNGEGMSYSDASLSFLKHATSKISFANDLFKINTLGFRGEALTSIAAISQLEMYTCCDDNDIGTRILIEGGDIKEHQPIKTKKGTNILVKNIFYNLPVRRTFLKSAKIEFRHILYVFYTSVLAHPHVSYQLYNNKKCLFNLTKTYVKNRIINIFGIKINKYLVYIRKKNAKSEIEGYLAQPYYAKKHRGEQFLFVNKRFITNKYLHKAVIEAFSGFLPRGYIPSYFLFIKIETYLLDINIHPTKTEIRFNDENHIFNIIKFSIKNALYKYEAYSFFRKKNIEVLCKENCFKQLNHLKDKNTFFRKKIMIIGYNNYNVFQIYNKYLLCIKNDNFIFINQKRASLRILYEKLLKKQCPKQKLLFTIFFSNFEINIIKEWELYLINIGFTLSFFDEKIIIETLPLSMNKSEIRHLMHALLEKKDIHDHDKIKNLAWAIAKIMAIKKGKSLNKYHMISIVNELFSCKTPCTTPNGKIIFLVFDIKNIN